MGVLGPNPRRKTTGALVKIRNPQSDFHITNANLHFRGNLNHAFIKPHTDDLPVISWVSIDITNTTCAVNKSGGHLSCSFSQMTHFLTSQFSLMGKLPALCESVGEENQPLTQSRVCRKVVFQYRRQILCYSSWRLRDTSDSVWPLRGHVWTTCEDVLLQRTRVHGFNMFGFSKVPQ